MKPKRLLPLGVLLVCFTATASLTGAQKSAPPQPTEQQKLKERVDALESQLKEAQAKADRAAMEKDYIERYFVQPCQLESAEGILRTPEQEIQRNGFGDWLGFADFQAMVFHCPPPR